MGEMEATCFVAAHGHLIDDLGHRRVVRHSYLPDREIQTGIGPVAVRCPRVCAAKAGVRPQHPDWLVGSFPGSERCYPGNLG